MRRSLKSAGMLLIGAAILSIPFWLCSCTGRVLQLETPYWDATFFEADERPPCEPAPKEP